MLWEGGVNFLVPGDRTHSPQQLILGNTVFEDDILSFKSEYSFNYVYYFCAVIDATM
jgi:hypothetical protein